jgi:hypothetical protein
MKSTFALSVLNVMFFSLTINGAADAQELKWIKFIYYGEQFRPHGTFIMAVDSLIPPRNTPLEPLLDRGLTTEVDSFNAEANRSFGWGIQANQITVNTVMAFVREGKYTVEKDPRTNVFDAGYRIIDSKGEKYYLPECNFPDFFNAISDHLKEEKFDDVVATAFGGYNSFWRKRYNGNTSASDSAPPLLGIPITKSIFDSLVQHVLIEFQSENNKRTIEDYLTFVRAEDTYLFYKLESKNENPLWQLYRNKFGEIFKALEAHGGGSTLFAKNGMMIGGGPTKNNFYRIKSSCELSSP